MPTYTYIGDADTVFFTLLKNGHTWVASKNDTIDLDEPVGHPLLVLTPPAAETKIATPAPQSENNESPVTADEQQEN